jgi:hypothetical protein
LAERVDISDAIPVELDDGEGLFVVGLDSRTNHLRGSPASMDLVALNVVTWLVQLKEDQNMADPIGEFALNHIGNVYAKNDDGVVVAHANYEGAAAGFGTVMGTMSSPLPVSGVTSGAPLSDEVLTWRVQ